MLALTVFAARLGDLLHEARADLGDEDYADLLALASLTIARQVADELERRWQS